MNDARILLIFRSGLGWKHKLKAHGRVLMRGASYWDTPEDALNEALHDLQIARAVMAREGGAK